MLLLEAADAASQIARKFFRKNPKVCVLFDQQHQPPQVITSDYFPAIFKPSTSGKQNAGNC